MKKTLGGSFDGGEVGEICMENDFFTQLLPQARDVIHIRGIRWLEQEWPCGWSARNGVSTWA